MYELKFRVWHPHKCGGCFIAQGVDLVYLQKDASQSLELPLLMSEKGVIVEQFTGLQDKNGVDIYEGDFIRCKGSAQSPYDHSDPNLRVVKRDTKTHQLGLFGSVNDEWQASGFGLSETTNKRWEVVGNIHEGI